MFSISPYPHSTVTLFYPEARQILEHIGIPKCQHIHPPFLLSSNNIPPLLKPWIANQWLDTQLITFDSIKDCANALVSMKRNWAPYFPIRTRRGQLIQDALPHVSAKSLVFNSPMPAYGPLGSWTLLNEHQALASANCTSIRPNGEWTFVEDKQGPPSRAYLKLWEALTRMGVHPKPGELCLDLGASPGGWTWVLAQQLSARVMAFDRAELTPDLMTHPNVHFETRNAFSVDPRDFPDATWLVCDVICYPAKLYEYVCEKLLPSSIQYAVCTIKFQGVDHYSVTTDFASIPSNHVLHLSHNKNELTWLYERYKHQSMPDNR